MVMPTKSAAEKLKPVTYHIEPGQQALLKKAGEELRNERGTSIGQSALIREGLELVLAKYGYSSSMATNKSARPQCYGQFNGSLVCQICLLNSACGSVTVDPEDGRARTPVTTLHEAKDDDARAELVTSLMEGEDSK